MAQLTPERVGRLGLVAVLGEEDRHAARARLAVGGEGAVEERLQPRRVGQRHEVGVARLQVRGEREVVRVVGVAGHREQAGVRGREVGAVVLRRAADGIGGGALQRMQALVDAVQGAQEHERLHRRGGGLRVRALRRGLAGQDHVGLVAGGRKRGPGGVDERAVQARRGWLPVLPLRRQPAALVGLVPERPIGHARQRPGGGLGGVGVGARMGAGRRGGGRRQRERLALGRRRRRASRRRRRERPGVASADGLHELAELGRVRVGDRRRRRRAAGWRWPTAGRGRRGRS